MTPLQPQPLAIIFFLQLMDGNSRILWEDIHSLLSKAQPLTPAALFHETEGCKHQENQLNLANGRSSSPPACSLAAPVALRLWLALLCAAAACSLAAGLSFFGAGLCQDSHDPLLAAASLRPTEQGRRDGSQARAWTRMGPGKGAGT